MARHDGVCDRNCYGCKYYGRQYKDSELNTCDYYMVTKKAKPLVLRPDGTSTEETPEECTVREMDMPSPEKVKQRIVIAGMAPPPPKMDERMKRMHRAAQQHLYGRQEGLSGALDKLHSLETDLQAARTLYDAKKREMAAAWVKVQEANKACSEQRAVCRHFQTKSSAEKAWDRAVRLANMPDEKRREILDYHKDYNKKYYKKKKDEQE